MKKSSAYLVLFVFLMTFCSIFAFSQEADLIGTWKGATFIPDVGENEVTLVITKKEGELTVAMSDSLGMLTDAECEDIEFQDGTLTFKFTISQDMETQTIWITLEVENHQMNGYWETGSGEQGDIELKKQ
jgi:hypothetical protein